MLAPLLFMSLYLHPPTLTLPETPEPLPAVSDLARFPSYDLCADQLAFFAARRAWLDNLRGSFADPIYSVWFDAATEDVEARRLPWAVLYEAHGWAVGADWLEGEDGRHYPGEKRNDMARRKLAVLRALLGDDAFDRGEMPSAVGVEFWRRAD